MITLTCSVLLAETDAMMIGPDGPLRSWANPFKVDDANSFISEWKEVGDMEIPAFFVQIEKAAKLLDHHADQRSWP
jgi:hypothetical protein